ncbi:hypothetical protein BH10BAC4_BH10BAC4_02370 [soil metagenome]
MQTPQAEKILTKIMSWSVEEVAKERPLIEALSSFKYNEYHQFFPGERFIESLARWLVQFDSIDRKLAYDFVIRRLIFVSSDQMAHLVSITYVEKVYPRLITKTAEQLRLDKSLVKKISSSKEFIKNKRKSLFIGLSDGSRIDQFRRNSRANNEQVYPTYSISKGKADEMIKDLQNFAEGYEKDKFNSIYLIDDFTASGISFFRENEGKGKILKFFKLLFLKDDSKPNADRDALDVLIDKTNLDVHIIFYVATKTAISRLQQKILAWKTENKIDFAFSVSAIQELDDSLKEALVGDVGFEDFLKKYFCNEIIDDHYKKGNHENPHFGFDECGLPIVLFHNTPNNALPILWFPEDLKFVGLFPRVTRHKE